VAPSLKLHLVTLGVADVERAATFYRALGMHRRLKDLKDVAFFDAGGVVLSVWDRKSLATDSGLEDSRPGFGGIALAFNVESETAVEAVLEAAAKAGGKILKPAQRAFWGGYHGHFADPDGHPWEVAHNPQFPFDERGQIVLPE
jgi:catechol 2,3-dioxygenase-like lactoylglutathione lyase family enzyme